MIRRPRRFLRRRRQRSQGKDAAPLTLAVNIRVLLEASLHGSEFLDTVDALGLFRAVDETRECSLEVFTTRAMRHTAETRAVPVDLASLLVVSGLLRIGFGFSGLVLDDMSGRRVGGRGLGSTGRLRSFGGSVAVGLFRVNVDGLVGGRLIVERGVWGTTLLSGD